MGDSGALIGWDAEIPDSVFNPALDLNNDGRIDITDFGQFSVRFFTSLP